MHRKSKIRPGKVAVSRVEAELMHTLLNWFHFDVAVFMCLHTTPAAGCRHATWWYQSVITVLCGDSTTASDKLCCRLECSTLTWVGPTAATHWECFALYPLIGFKLVSAFSEDQPGFTWPHVFYNISILKKIKTRNKIVFFLLTPSVCVHGYLFFHRAWLWSKKLLKTAPAFLTLYYFDSIPITVLQL